MDAAAIAAHLRRHYLGLLAVGDRFDPVRFVLDPAKGLPVLAVEADTVDEETLTLHVPDDSDESAIHLLGQPRELDRDRDAACDRFRIYFGEPITRRWIALELDSVKGLDGVVDAQDLDLSNPLIAQEPRLCRELNADHTRLAALCRMVAAGISPGDPRAVGVDPGGIDIRAAFGIIRVEFRTPLLVADGLAAACADLLDAGLRPA